MWEFVRVAAIGLCNNFDAIFIKNGVFEGIFINENLFNKKYNIISRNSNENE